MHSINEACQLGKTCRQHFSTTKTKTSKMLELLHTNLWGLSYIVSRNGYKYYINFVDDYSKLTRFTLLNSNLQPLKSLKIIQTSSKKPIQHNHHDVTI